MFAQSTKRAFEWMIHVYSIHHALSTNLAVSNIEKQKHTIFIPIKMSKHEAWFLGLCVLHLTHLSHKGWILLPASLSLISNIYLSPKAILRHLVSIRNGPANVLRYTVKLLYLQDSFEQIWTIRFLIHLINYISAFVGNNKM